MLNTEYSNTATGCGGDNTTCVLLLRLWLIYAVVATTIGGGVHHRRVLYKTGRVEAHRNTAGQDIEDGGCRGSPQPTSASTSRRRGGATASHGVWERQPLLHVGSYRDVLQLAARWYTEQRGQDPGIALKLCLGAPCLLTRAAVPDYMETDYSESQRCRSHTPIVLG